MRPSRFMMAFTVDGWMWRTSLSVQWMNQETSRLKAASAIRVCIIVLPEEKLASLSSTKWWFGPLMPCFPITVLTKNSAASPFENTPSTFLRSRCSEATNFPSSVRTAAPMTEVEMSQPKIIVRSRR